MLPTIKVSQIKDISDPKLRAVAQTFADIAIFSAQKAMAHRADPTKFPLPAAANSLEQIFDKYIRTLPPDIVKAATIRVAAEVKRDPLRATPNTLVLRRVNMQSAVSIEAQVQQAGPSLSPKITIAELREAVGIHVPVSHRFRPKQSDAALELDIVSVNCDEETGLTSAGSDSMNIGGAAIDAVGNVATIGPYGLGTYDSGTNRTINGLLTTFDLAIGRGWPRSYFVVLAPSNKAVGGLIEFINGLVQKARDYIASYAGAAVGAVVGGYVGGALGAIGGPVGAALGALVGAAVGYVVGWAIDHLWGWIKNAFGGHVFQPVTLQLDLPFYGATLSSGPFSAWWSGAGGHYTMWFQVQQRWGHPNVVTAATPATDSLSVFEVGSDTFIRNANWGADTNWNWTPLSPILGGQSSPDNPVSVACRNTNTVDVFTMGLDGRVWTAARGPHSNNQWVGWWPVGDQTFILGTQVGAVSRAPDQLDIFVTGTDGGVYSAAWGQQTNYGEWVGWWRILNGVFPPGCPISAVSRAKDQIDIFGVGCDGGVYSAAWGQQTNYGEWAGWWRILNGVFPAGACVSAISRRENYLDIFATGLDGGVYSAGWAGEWNGWWRIGSGVFKLGSPITVVSRGPDNLDLFGVDADNRICTSSWGPQTNGEWSEWVPVLDAQAAPGSPVAAVARNPNQLDIFFTGLDGNIWTAAWLSNKWNGCWELPNG